MCVQAWFDAKVVTDEIKIAHDAASIKVFRHYSALSLISTETIFQKLRLMVEQAFSDYQILGDACNYYQCNIYDSDLYWAYQDAINGHSAIPVKVVMS